MALSGYFGVSMNLECIRRIMRKYNIMDPDQESHRDKMDRLSDRKRINA